MRALQLLREVQIAGGFGMRVEEDKAKRSTAVLFFQSDDLPAEILAKRRRPPATGRSVRPGERS